MIRLLSLLFFSQLFSQSLIVEYGYTAPHSLNKESIGYGDPQSYFGFSYVYNAYSKNMKTSLRIETWKFIKDDVFGSFNREFKFYTISQSISVYDGLISIYPGIEVNILSEGNLTSSSSYGSLNTKIAKTNDVLYGMLLDLIYSSKKISIQGGARYSFQDLLEDRASSNFRIQFGIGYKF